MLTDLRIAEYETLLTFIEQGKSKDDAIRRLRWLLIEDISYDQNAIAAARAILTINGYRQPEHGEDPQ